eukprot:654250-Amphidinium_carterae.1
MPEQLMLALAVTAHAVGLRTSSPKGDTGANCMVCLVVQVLSMKNNDTKPGSVEAAIALPQTKTSDRGARLQSVSIDDTTVADLLVRTFGSDPPNRCLIAGGSRGLQTFFERVHLALNLQNTPWTLATLRGGGALAYLRQTGGNIIWLQFRGRWESAKSMRHYIQAGLAMQAYAALNQDTKLRIAALAELAPVLLTQDVPADSHPVVEKSG